MRWDPTQYGRYAGQRSRPFFDLVSRIAAQAPSTVVDLGCGTGELTVTLKQRWPEARVRGIDSSPEMIERAPEAEGVTFELGRAEDFEASGVDVLLSNALLQWVPDHERLIVEWAAQLNPGGWLALQVPSNFGAPSHRLMRLLADSPDWRPQLHGVLRADPVFEPPEYLDLLARQSLEAEVWQTEYLHVLQGENPVLEWVRGTGLRPVLNALSEQDADRFCSEYAALVRESYPPKPYGTVFGFLRTFAVAHKTA